MERSSLVQGIEECITDISELLNIGSFDEAQMALKALQERYGGDEKISEQLLALEETVLGSGHPSKVTQSLECGPSRRSKSLAELFQLTRQPKEA